MATNGSTKLTQLTSILNTSVNDFIYVVNTQDGGTSYASKKIGIVQLVADILAKSDLDAFTGNTIADDSTIKEALQALETALETAAAVGTTNTSDLALVDARVATIEADNATQTELDAAISAEETARDAAISTAIANLVDSAPATLDTLNEIAAALGDDPNLSTTLTNLISGNSTKIGNLETLSGVASGETDLGTFTGTTISDGQTVKSALQELETAVEGNDADIVSLNAQVATNVGDIATLQTELDAAEVTLGNKVDVGANIGAGILVGNTTADATPTTYYFLVVDQATGQIKVMDKSFLELEEGYAAPAGEP